MTASNPQKGGPDPLGTHRKTHANPPSASRAPLPHPSLPRTKPRGLKTHVLQSALSEHPHDVRKATVVAFVVQRGSIVSVGYNRKVFKDGRNDFSKHAEVDALNKAGRRAEGATLLVIRVKKDGTYGNACPCLKCYDHIIKRGIGPVKWSKEEWNE